MTPFVGAGLGVRPGAESACPARERMLPSMDLPR